MQCYDTVCFMCVRMYVRLCFVHVSWVSFLKAIFTSQICVSLFECLCTVCMRCPWKPGGWYWSPGAGVVAVMWVLGRKPRFSAKAATAAPVQVAMCINVSSVCICVHLSVCIYLYVYLNLHSCVCTFVCMCSYVLVCIYVWKCMCLYLRTYLCIFVHVWVYKCTQSCMFVCICQICGCS